MTIVFVLNRLLSDFLRDILYFCLGFISIAIIIRPYALVHGRLPTVIERVSMSGSEGLAQKSFSLFMGGLTSPVPSKTTQHYLR